MRTHKLHFQIVDTNYIFHAILLHITKSKLGSYDLQVSVVFVKWEQIFFIKFSDIISSLRIQKVIFRNLF